MTAPTHLGRYVLVAPSDRRRHLAHTPRNPSDLVVLERAALDVSTDLPRAERVLAESRRLTSLVAPALLPLREVFLARSGAATLLCLAHKYAPGFLLSDLLLAARRRDEPVPTAVASAVASALLQGVEDLHTMDAMTHLRLTPGHALIGRDGLRLLCPHDGLPSWSSAWHTDEQRSSFRYLAPEQARGEPPSVRTDVFQTAGILWELLAGRLRVEAPDLLGLLGRIQFQAPASLRPARADVTEALDGLVKRALARRPQERPASAREFRTALALVEPPASWLEVRSWASGLGAEPFPGPEVFLIEEGTTEPEPPSSRPEQRTYRG